MAARPKKRQKRLVVASSEEEEDIEIIPTLRTDSKKCELPDESNNHTQQSLPTRSLVKASKVAPSHFTTSKAFASRNSSGNHSKEGRSKNKQSKDARPRAISTFFTTGTINHGIGVYTQRSSTEAGKESNEEVGREEDDVIEDDFLVEQTGSQLRFKQGLDHERRQASSRIPEQKPLSASQRFKISPNEIDQEFSRKRGSTAKVSDGRPWAERYGPSTLEELAVNKKKVTEVRTWLERIWSGLTPQSLLILKGPSGAGKSATIEALAKDMGFTIAEWRNPVGSDFSSEGYSSMSAQFSDFLGRSSRFGTLAVASKSSTSSPESFSRQDLHPYSKAHRIILINEFPNVSLNDTNILQSFRSSIMEYLTSFTPSIASYHKSLGISSPFIPLVMIITETRLTSSAAVNESFTAHRLLGSELLNHTGVSVIDFGPIAATFLSKALNLVLQKEARRSGRRRIPSSSVLKKLGEVGDIRSAIGSLEFLCVRGDDRYDWGGRVAAKGKKGASASSSFTKMEQQSLEMVTQREASLGIFHAVGKVVYNKRHGDNNIGNAERHATEPPNHLLEHARPRSPQVNVNNLVDETGCDSSTFIAALHENYLMSCEGSQFISTLNGCVDALSDTDVLVSPRRSRFGLDGGHGRASQGTAVDSLRTEEISFQLAVRSILFSLPDPVRRATHPVGIPGRSGGKADAYKMYYPTSIRLFKQMEETSILVDRWVAYLQGVSLMSSTAQGTTHHSLLPGQRTARKAIDEKSQAVEGAHDEPRRIILNTNRSELIVERLPYLSKIELQSPWPGHLPELGKITLFSGIDIPGGGHNEYELDEYDVLPSLQGNDPRLGFQQSREEDVKGGSKSAMQSEEKLEKLYLIDDDIEDD